MKNIDIFPWDDNFDTGLPKIDEQHRKLVDLLNLLASHVAFHADLPRLNEIFDRMTDYALYHFETEEAIWREFLGGDESEVEHRRTHARFVETIAHLRDREKTRPADEVVEEVLAFLARWLASHILETDRFMAYAVLARQDGLSVPDAKARAAVQMGGSTRALIDIILSIYETLSMNTLRLMREIAQRKKNEAILDEARRQAEAGNVAKTRFLGNMSHEVRTPLNAILGMAQLLCEPGVSEKEREEYAQSILDAGRGLLELLTGVLDYSRIESGALALEPDMFDPKDLVRSSVDAYAEAARAKGLTLLEPTATDLAPAYRGDARRLGQMLAHLLSNAVKFTDQGSIRVDLREIGREGDTATLEFSVSDTGIGVAPEARAQLFDPFVQADDSLTRAQGGTGLGLAIVASLARLMDGEMGCESAPGEGSRFWFRVRVKMP